jgi:hypothetical protein
MTETDNKFGKLKVTEFGAHLLNTSAVPAGKEKERDLIEITTSRYR